MKKFLLLVLLTGTIAFCNAQNVAPQEVREFVSRFEQVVMTHHYDSVMAYMDDEYVKVQYKKLLKKDAEQFIDEFFSGNENIDYTGPYINTRLIDISAISMQSLEVLPNEEYQVTFMITRISGYSHYCHVMLRKFRKQLGFFGAVG